jgi:LTXXQ motif family protein
MKISNMAIGAILLLSAAVIAMPMTAEAFGGHGGGGGGGFHGGGGGGFHGGGFGGGGFHGGGFGGGGFHGGGLGGGGFHGGGLGGFRGGGLGGFRGGGLGGFRSGGLGGFRGGGLGGLRGGGLGGIRSGRAGGFHQGGISHQAIQGGNRQGFQGGNRQGFQGVNQQGLQGGNRQGFQGRNGLLATRSAQGFGRNGFGHNGFGRNGFGRNGFGRNGFGRNGFWHNGFAGGDYYRYGGFGWVGPMFWPYAYSDLSCGIFWGYGGFGCGDPYWGVAFGDPFWGYGYDDIYGGLFSPFAFNDLAPYLPNGPTYVSHARSRRALPPADAIAQMCGDDTKEVASWPIDRIQQLVSPDDQQRMALNDLASASIKAAQIIKSGCPTSVAFTPTDRLAAMQQRMEAMKQAVDTVSTPLDAFYASLTDEQKAKFNATSQPPATVQQNGRRREPAPEPAQSCTAANSATQWPEARLETALRPNELQETKLKALQSAAAQAAEQLAASCPSEMPITPPARLAAISKRLDVMLTAVTRVRGALDDLYSGLSDEQKAQFNKIGQAPSRTAQRQG